MSYLGDKMRLFAALAAGLVLNYGQALAAQPAGAADTAAMTAAYNSGNFKGAYELGCRLLKKEPGNLAVHYLLGNCYVKLGQPERAQVEYKYCEASGGSSQVGKYAAQALEQLSATSAAAKPAEGEIEPAEPAAPPPDKTDLETLEYKERLLKTGTDLIAQNRAKLQKQIEAVHRRTEDALDNLKAEIESSPNRITAMSGFGQARDQLLEEEAAQIKLLQHENEREEQKITAFYQSQIDKIGSQKGNLASQTRAGKTDLRMVEKGSGLFVRNYINFHGEPPPPPPPPELRATAKKLNPGVIPVDKKAHE